MLIAFAFGVLATVYLDNQILLQGRKVHDIWANQSLSTELHPGKAMRTQVIPEPALGLGHVRTKGLGVIS